MAGDREFVAMYSSNCSINNLPEEILITIANNLTFKDLTRMQKTCKLWYYVTGFVIDRRGPQTLSINMHFNFNNCQICYGQPFKYTLVCDKCLMFCRDVTFGRSMSLCEDKGTYEEVLKDLYCDPQCVIMFRTNSLMGSSRIGMNINLSIKIFYILSGIRI